MLAHLPLSDEGAFIAIEELDGRLKREDMNRSLTVDIIDERRQGGASATAAGAS